MTEEIRKKIDDRAASYYTSIESGLKIAHTAGFNRGADFAYSLAEKEIERLKGLVELAHKDGYPDHVSDQFKEEMWQQFKTDNQL